MKTINQKTIEIIIEKNAFTKQDFLGGSPMVRTGIQIHINQICITGATDAFRVVDYLPHNCVQWLNAVKVVKRGEQGQISFSDTVCDVYLHPVDDAVVAISAERYDGSKFNPAVPDEGIQIPQSDVVAEVLAYSRAVRDRFEAIDPGTKRSNTVQQLHELIAEVETTHSDT